MLAARSVSSSRPGTFTSRPATSTVLPSRVGRKLQTWSRPKKLFEGFYGPIRNKPIELADGTILAGSSVESSGWLVQMERTKNVVREWTKTRYLNSSMEWAAIQPTILPWDDGSISGQAQYTFIP